MSASSNEHCEVDDQERQGLQHLVEQWQGTSSPSWKVERMPGGASTRRFFRVQLANPDQSAVAFYLPEPHRSDEIDKTDGQRKGSPFVEIQQLLSQRGVAVPKILADRSEQGWLLVEDLGDDTLANYLQRKPHQKERAYQQAVTVLAKAQKILHDLPKDSVVNERAFDTDLLEWEIHHFREWALEAQGVTLSAKERTEFDSLAHSLAKRISDWPRGFVHRDYQSRNLMVREGAQEAVELVWIDFQDALLGPRIYDLVALLNDSYQVFERSFVEQRLDEFAAHQSFSAEERNVLGLEFDVVTVQRKLKDAGRFIFIDKTKNNPSFLEFVNPTIEKACASLARVQSDEAMHAWSQWLTPVLARLGTGTP
jgi:N-acetylmuramate 1-kinase